MNRHVQGSARRRLAGRVLLALAFNLACFLAMNALAVWSESRPVGVPGPLRDVVLDAVPFSPWVFAHNYWVWLAAALSGMLLLGATAPARFARYLVTAGLASLTRGAAVVLTGLPPATPGYLADPNAGMTAGEIGRAWLQVVDPLSVFFAGSAHVFLTKDLFFSGHVASTFLLVLYAWPVRWLRIWALVAHAAVVATVFLAHLHYTIDVVAAYPIAFTLFALREGRPGGWLRPADLGPRWG